MNKNKSGKYYFELRARGNELDSYGHVNNAVYLNYNEQARWEIFRQLGLLDTIIASGKKIVIVENQIKYIRQVRLFDEIIVETQMEISAYFLLFRHLMLNKKTGKRVAKSLVKTVFLDENNKACDIPDSLLDTFTEE
ncbi:MAG: acyl-CoA thioesterase [Bacteroidetes bacterium]|nr:MAG: acyl-CoA thioesterase [Bacteroidota bacterium]